MVIASLTIYHTCANNRECDVMINLSMTFYGGRKEEWTSKIGGRELQRAWLDDKKPWNWFFILDFWVKLTIFRSGSWADQRDSTERITSS